MKMRRSMLKSKIHRATVTSANIHYIGSITLDPVLMEAADILPYEKVTVLNLHNGARFETYAIEGERKSGVVCLNGAAARLAQPGDLVIILTYVDVDAEAKELKEWKPRIVFVDEKNRIIEPADKKLVVV
jgi:aspartate 1-decarboxylase